MASLSPTDYDCLTGDDLFDSFMNVALHAEKETDIDSLIDELKSKSPSSADAGLINSSKDTTTNKFFPDEDNKKIENLKLDDDKNIARHSPTDERIKGAIPPDSTNLQENLVESQTNIDNETTESLHDSNQSLELKTDNDMKSSDSPKIDNKKPQENPYALVAQYTPKTNQDISALYAVPDKSKKLEDNRGTFYADVTVSSTNPPLKKPIHTYTDYAEVTIKDPTPSQVPVKNSDYEDISDYLKEEPKTVEPLSPETIAYGNRALSKGQNEMYKTITTTIERGTAPPQTSPRSSSGHKRSFFGFGSKKSSSFDNSPTSPRTFSDSTNRHSAEYQENHADQKNFERQSSIPVVCSGYLFKQGGTGFTPKNWRLRWFELKKDNCLYYYKSEQDHAANGAVMLMKYSISRAAEVNKRYAFKLSKGGARTYFFAANSDEEMRKWMKHLGEAAKQSDSDHVSIPECSLKNVSISALSIKEPECHGWLYKQGNSHKSWKKRYCVLKYACLFYYEDMTDECAVGVFKLHHYTVTSKDSNIKFGFIAKPPMRKMRTYYFHTESEIDFKRWIEAMRHSIANLKS